MVQQRYKMANGQQQHFSKSRTAHLTATGLTVGTLCHYWYQTLDRLLPGSGIKVVFKKLAVDQILFSPVCISVFFVTLAISKKCLLAFTGQPTTSVAFPAVRSAERDASRPTSELETFIHDFKHKGAVLYLSEWLVWPPAQLVNFYFLPTRYRVLYDNCVSFVYDIYTSHICYDVEVEDIKRLAVDTEQLFSSEFSSRDEVTNLGVQSLIQSSLTSNAGNKSTSYNNNNLAHYRKGLLGSSMTAER